MTIARTGRRSFLVGTGAAAALGTFGGLARPSWAAAPSFKTVAPGVLTIANSNEMPMIAMEGGKLIGSDADQIDISGRNGHAVRQCRQSDTW